MSTPPRPLPDSYEGILRRAQIALNAGDMAEAMALYRRLIERLSRLSDRILDRRPELRDMHRQAIPALAFLLRREGRYAEAIEVTEPLLEIDPEHAADWRRDLASLRIAKGEVEVGLAELRALAEEYPDDVRNWLALGVEARVEGRFDDSQSALNQALDVGRGDEPEAVARAHYEHFLLYKDMGLLDDAVAAWEEAVAVDPSVGNTIREVYDMFTKVGRYGEAQRYVARDENELQAGFHRGLINSLRGNLAGARQEWRAVADLDPSRFEYGHDCWVEAVLRLRDPDLALEALQDVLARHMTPRLLILSGVAWAMKEDGDLSAALFQQAIRLLRTGRPPKQKLDSVDWRLLDSLVADAELKTKLKPYFAVVETIWG